MEKVTKGKRGRKPRNEFYYKGFSLVPDKNGWRLVRYTEEYTVTVTSLWFPNRTQGTKHIDGLYAGKNRENIVSLSNAELCA